MSHRIKTYTPDAAKVFANECRARHGSKKTSMQHTKPSNLQRRANVVATRLLSQSPPVGAGTTATNQPLAYLPAGVQLPQRNPIGRSAAGVPE
jgi:hypothetical protein